MYFDQTEYGKRIATLRKLRGLTQEEAAEALGITLDYLKNMEPGKRAGSRDLDIQMACYFHVSLDYLETGKEFDHSAERSRLLAVASELLDIAKTV